MLSVPVIGRSRSLSYYIWNDIYIQNSNIFRTIRYRRNHAHARLQCEGIKLGTFLYSDLFLKNLKSFYVKRDASTMPGFEPGSFDCRSTALINRATQASDIFFSTRSSLYNLYICHCLRYQRIIGHVSDRIRSRQV